MSAPALSLDSTEPPAASSPAAPSVGAMAGVRPGAIILTRHGEPALSRKCLITARQYGDWWARYEVGGLLAGQTPPPELIAAAQGAGAIYASTRQRAQETAAAVAAGREVMSDVMFIEAPLPPPPVPEWIRLSPKWWGVVSRFWWHAFDHHDGQETRAQAEARAAQAARKLIARAEGGQDVLVFAHGYFNHMVGRALKGDGWRLVQNQGFKYWSQRRYEKR
ncbi:MAG: histidine phosphatase family protein [Brevundimonas sp.]|uniref:histidine phosphatase family protein n=1 Tax=Brevundimonas sp. TaxID=1871086 RepID=UPI000DB09595|nr:histidine phosphatase family protein [Brevundimonas sp.]PZU00586.1 MAG: histidine phosphatase family protein [Brevundimonas sp.]